MARLNEEQEKLWKRVVESARRFVATADEFEGYDAPGVASEDYAQLSNAMAALDRSWDERTDYEPVNLEVEPVEPPTGGRVTRHG